MKKFGCIALSTMLLVTSLAACGQTEVPENTNADHYEITIACQKNDSEEGVVKALIKAYEAKNTNVKINLETFSGDDFETYMNGIAEMETSNPDETPHIIWTSDTTHARWQQYFTDLRPYYEQSAETDYSLYYESMLDTASFNGHFKPTKNYTGSFRSNDKDSSDGLESYQNHSEYGLYFAPRDYNKPTLLCNLGLFDDLDTQYEAYYMEKEGISTMPAGYVSTTERLEGIVAGQNWDDLTDLFTFAQEAAERVVYVIDYATALGTTGQKVKNTWANRTVLDMKLTWEPTYTTILTAMGMDGITKADGSLDLESHKDILETLHGYIQGENLYYAALDDNAFKNNETFMKIVSRPAMVSAASNLSKQQADYVEKYNRTPLQAIAIPTEKVAAGCSGYAINNIYEGKGMTVNGVYKSFADLSWDFIKFIITEEGQEVAGATGNNVPILKSLKDTGCWREVEGLAHMDHDAWIAGEELKQDWFNCYQATYRIQFRNTIEAFFRYYQTSDYGSGGSLDTLISKTNTNYAASKPQNYLR